MLRATTVSPIAFRASRRCTGAVDTSVRPNSEWARCAPGHGRHPGHPARDPPHTDWPELTLPVARLPDAYGRGPGHITFELGASACPLNNVSHRARPAMPRTPSAPARKGRPCSGPGGPSFARWYCACTSMPVCSSRRFLLVTAVTGLLYAGSFQAEKLIYAHELSVPAGERTLPLSQQVADARKAHPEGKVAAVRPAPQPGDTTRVLLSDVPGVTAEHQLAVFVDPHTGSVRGALETYGVHGRTADAHLARRSPPQSPPGRERPPLQRTGRQLAVGGRRRRARAVDRTQAHEPQTAGPRTAGSHRHRTAQDAVMARRGGGVGGGRPVLPLRHGSDLVRRTPGRTSTNSASHWGRRRRPSRRPWPRTMPTTAAPAGWRGWPTCRGWTGRRTVRRAESASADVGIDKVLKAARAEGLSNPVEIGPADGQGSAYVVKQVQRSWPEKQDAVAVDPGTGRSPTSRASRTTPSSPSSPATASTCTPAPCSASSTRSPWPRSPSR